MNKLFKTNKGQLAMGGPLNLVIGLVFALFFIGVLTFTYALAGSEILSTQTEDQAVNTTTVSIQIINKTLVGVESFAEFSPVLWIMAAIAALLLILVAGVAVFFVGRAREDK